MPALRQISLGRHCFGLTLRGLVSALVGAAKANMCGLQRERWVSGAPETAPAPATLATPVASHTKGAQSSAKLSHKSLSSGQDGSDSGDSDKSDSEEDQPQQQYHQGLMVRLVKQMAGDARPERDGLQAREVDVVAAQQTLRGEGVSHVVLTLSGVIM